MATRNTINLDTDLGDEGFDNYIAGKEVGDTIELHVRAKITSKDEQGISAAVNTVYKMDGWDNPESDGEPNDEGVEDSGGEEMLADDEEGHGPRAILMMVGPRKGPKTRQEY